MNFSDQWRSLWPIASVPHAPNLLCGDQATPLGPLLFHPSPTSRILFATSSLALRIPTSLPPSIFDGIRTFFRRPTNSSFLTTTDQFNLAADIHSSIASAASDPLDPLCRNNLHALACHDGSSVILFFPTGDNADEIGFLYLYFRDESLEPEVGVDLDGDIFKQKEGLKHPCHRILKLSIASSQADYSMPTGNCIIEGFLMAATLYSVNWFRVETMATVEGRTRPLLVPLAKQGFSSCVVDACWSPHFWEESAVLLENGELCWFNLISKRGGTLKISLPGSVDPGRWLGCKFGGQPWVLLAACSIAVVLIDLRPKRISEAPKVLARVKLPDFLGEVSMEEEKDVFQAFCRPDFSDFHFTAVTEKLLLLFDIRQPLVPILTWDHGLEHPTYVSMFRLSEFRPSEEFKLASESGFVIIVGSFWQNDFKVFCYGSSDKGAFGSSLYAWELPSSLSLSGKQWSSADDLVREMLMKEKLPNQEILLRKEGVAGFCVLPANIRLKCKPKPNGFVLIRLMLSGRLEIQDYHSIYDFQDEDLIHQRVDLQKAEDFTIFSTHEGSNAFSRFHFFNFYFFAKYMNQNLSSALITRYLESTDRSRKHNSCNDELKEHLRKKVHHSTISSSTLMADVSIPVSVFEVASRRVLTTLHPDIQSLAFTKYGELFTGNAETSFLPLEFPESLLHHRFPPFFVNIPSKRSEMMPTKVLTGDAIVGPVLPLPVLLFLQQKVCGRAEVSTEVDDLDGDLLTLECKDVLENVFPETSIADNGGFSGRGASQEFEDDKQYFVYQPTFSAYRSTLGHQSQMDHLSERCLGSEDISSDEKFMTFICGNFDKKCHFEYSEIFDVGAVKLDFESSNVDLQPNEQSSLKSLKRQASSWLENNKYYQDFCSSSKILKPVF